MSSTQRMIWTLLPYGRDPGTGNPRATVIVSPQLRSSDADPKLGTHFPDFTRWAEVIANARFSVEVKPGEHDDAADVPAAPVAGWPPDVTLWQAVFPESIRVRSYDFVDHSGSRLRSFPVADVLQHVKHLYSSVGAEAADDLPPVKGGKLEELVRDLGPVLGSKGRGRPDRHAEQLESMAKARYARIDRRFGRDKVIPLDDGRVADGHERTKLSYALAHRFYDRPEGRTPEGETSPPRPDPPEIDFHDMVTLLGDHPFLLRRLGLAVDLEVIGRLPIRSGFMRVAFAWEDPAKQTPAGQTVSAWTAFELDRRGLRAVPQSDDLADGMLVLDGANDSLEPFEARRGFDVVQVDADGAALKLVGTAHSLMTQCFVAKKDQAMDAPQTAGLPTLRSAGLSLVQRDRAARLYESVSRSRALRETDKDPHAELHLYLDDLVRGYRVDVEKDDEGWRTLHARQGSYRLGSIELRPADVPVDEGYLKSTSATSADQKDLYVHETVARWSGWSLSVERPGRIPHAEPDGSAPNGKPAQKELLEPRRPNDLATQFEVDATYDLVPGTLPRLRFGSWYRLRARLVDHAGNSSTLEEADEIHATDKVRYLRHEPVPPPELVTRDPFGAGESLNRMVIRSNWNVDSVDYESGDAAGTSERHVVPPKGSQQIAELHGRFDDWIGKGRPHAGGYDLAVREEGLLDGSDYVTVKGGEPKEGLSTEYKALHDDPPGSYVCHPDLELKLPYLADPLSTGVQWWRLPDALDPFPVDWSQAWPNPLPFRVRLIEWPLAPAGENPCRHEPDSAAKRLSWDDDQRVLNVALAKGEELTVRYSSTIDADGLDVLAVWRWLQEVGFDDEVACLAGLHWMLTPFRELTFVHAVQQPLCAPQVVPDAPKSLFAPDGFRADKSEVGATAADLSSRITLSASTTERIDIEAKWNEPIDDLARIDGPDRMDGNALAASMPVPRKFGDGAVRGLGRLGIARHEFGDTKHRVVHYRMVGTTRFREYVDPELTPEQLSRASDWYTTHVPNSARPLAPNPLYAIPSFAWDTQRSPDTTKDWKTVKSHRTGGGLRVWLDRPWFSSGDGELLGILLWTAKGPPPEEAAKFISHLGRDPIWDTIPPAGRLRPADFRSVAASEAGLSLEESSDDFGVVGYPVEWDETRRLWFADIELVGRARESYWPFVRLALARYQPWSMNDDVKLSRVTQLEFAQLLPSRDLHVAAVEGEPNAFTFSLSGVAPDGPRPNHVEISVEHHDGYVPGDLGWKPWPGMERIALNEGTEDWMDFIKELDIPVRLKRRLDLKARLQPRETVLAHRQQSQTVAEKVEPRHWGMVERERFLELGTSIDVSALPGSIPAAILPGNRTWSGRVVLPEPRSKHAFRFVVREYETHETDAEAVGSRNVEPKVYLTDRVVYAQIIELGEAPNRP